MKKLFKILGGFLAGISILIVMTCSWYVIKFYPRHADDLEFGNPNFSQKILIATQGSTYKNEVVQRLAEKLRAREVYIKVTDVSNLDSVDPDSWAEIIILNTSIADRMNTRVSHFLDMVGPIENILVITTSGGGDFVPPNLEVDGITTASRLNETEKMATRIFQMI
ncbi:MAG: hypothetical protein H8E26_03505 [FCB group bacterium]|nr:hypothetical protein [FCB group bacterium]MBL7028198.1 hypothetical protein [Candidatus Neomarinimicrobiota bacterium]MBL7122496.1 hypothetical protein [Candidatus Neomarinimicrobiota bacterium]